MSLYAKHGQYCQGQLPGQECTCGVFDLPAASAGYDSLSAKVDKLAKRANDLNALCGEILATICVNRSQGHLTTSNDVAFDKMVTVWRKRWEES